MSDRGMKKWAPYKSLNKQYEDIHRLREERHRVEKPLISSDEAEIINNILIHYNNESLIIKYYRDGKILIYEGMLTFVDAFNRLVKTENHKIINFKELISISIS